MTLIIGFLIPLLGTMLGAAFVFFMKDDLSPRVQKTLLGFASGVMVATSVWSLLIPAMETVADSGKWRALAVTIHNLPEGMAVGVVFAGAEQGAAGLSIASAVAVSLGIAIQNIPEGAIISMPMRAEGNSKWRSFLIGSLSGAVEPAGAVAVLLLASLLMPVMPYMLAFAAGAMFYVVVEELIPEASNGQHSNLSTIGFAVGFVLMMVLDVVMG